MNINDSYNYSTSSSNIYCITYDNYLDYDNTNDDYLNYNRTDDIYTQDACNLDMNELGEIYD